MRTTRRASIGLGATLVALVLAGCTQPDTPGADPTPSAGASTSESDTPTPTQGDVADLTFGVYGSAIEVDRYEAVADRFNATSTDTHVSVVSWPDRSAAAQAIELGETPPDIFLTSRRDLASLQGQGLIQPVDELLDERGVDFGDAYSRDSLQAFSMDNRLQCMPYGVSPMVMYYNTDLIDFDRMRARGLPTPRPDSTGGPPTRWSFEQFAAAAEFATRPGGKTRGVYIAPTLTGLAPFVVAGGGSIFSTDESDRATSLLLSEESSRDALETTLSVLRNPQITLSPRQLERRSAVEWFKRGRVALIAGFRDLVPQLREVEGLNFDVISMPVLSEAGTIGDFSGLCMSTATADPDLAADFLTYAVDESSVSVVTRAGFLVPANAAVAASSDFLQPGRLPVNARVFTGAIRDIYLPPVLSQWSELEDTIAPTLMSMVDTSVLAPEMLGVKAQAIDQKSRFILDPESMIPTVNPTESPN